MSSSHRSLGALRGAVGGGRKEGKRAQVETNEVDEKGMQEKRLSRWKEGRKARTVEDYEQN